MLSRRSSDLHKESFHIKQDDKFFTRLLSKESSIANPSFRVYYGLASSAVPFGWESQPGTPKASIHHNATIPPLMPPPSYSFMAHKNNNKKCPRSKLIQTILPRLALRKTHVPTPSPSPSLSSSSSTESADSRRRSRVSGSRSSFSSRGEDEEIDDGSPTSTLCFGAAYGSCYSIVIMKNRLLSIVGHGSS